MASVHIGSYVLDTLQIYFAWDDDLYTHLKEMGFGKGGFERKTMPIIYSDNCESTTREQERRRKYVISPRYFGKTVEALGWQATDRETEPIIVSEKPRVKVSLIDDDSLEFRICPQVDGQEQYHLEYSTMAAFGRLYSNWCIPVFAIGDCRDLLSRLGNVLSLPEKDFEGIPFLSESKQAQREQMFYVRVPINSYKFSIGEFVYARDFLLSNGVAGTIPSLMFRNQPPYLEKMNPILKLGFIHTTAQQGFEVRRPQIALKIAQEKMTTSLRGKPSKAKGIVLVDDRYENYFVVPARTFTTVGRAVVEVYSTP
ncbi:MAG: hypothetical protein WED04_09555 [Promethearchaeati archaeon SRVP18_Atabeyarchaeia-1]